MNLKSILKVQNYIEFILHGGGQIFSTPLLHSDIAFILHSSKAILNSMKLTSLVSPAAIKIQQKLNFLSVHKRAMFPTVSKYLV
jgi:hypothetical protein